MRVNSENSTVSWYDDGTCTVYGCLSYNSEERERIKVLTIPKNCRINGRQYRIKEVWIEYYFLRKLEKFELPAGVKLIEEDSCPSTVRKEYY